MTPTPHPTTDLHALMLRDMLRHMRKNDLHDYWGIPLSRLIMETTKITGRHPGDIGTAIDHLSEHIKEHTQS